MSVGLKMSKKQQRRQPEPMANQVPIAEQPAPRRYSPPGCASCVGLRPEGKEYTAVYSIRREAEYVVRYCRCGFCGNTYKDIERH